jgi:hypothetical protein
MESNTASRKGYENAQETETQEKGMQNVQAAENARCEPVEAEGRGCSEGIRENIKEEGTGRMKTTTERWKCDYCGHEEVVNPEVAYGWGTVTKFNGKPKDACPTCMKKLEVPKAETTDKKELTPKAASRTGWVIVFPSDPQYKGTDHYWNSDTQHASSLLENATVFISQARANFEMITIKEMIADRTLLWKGFLRPALVYLRDGELCGESKLYKLAARPKAKSGKGKR